MKVLSYLMIQSNQPIDCLINSSHVTSENMSSHFQNKLVLASAKCLKALLWLLLLNNTYVYLGAGGRGVSEQTRDVALRQQVTLNLHRAQCR